MYPRHLEKEAGVANLHQKFTAIFHFNLYGHSITPIYMTFRRGDSHRIFLEQ
jgi:hypothetical protein